MGQIIMFHTTGNLAGANINVNSAVSNTGVTLRSGGNLNVAGSLTNSGGIVMGLISDATHGATMKIQNGGTASLTTINVVDGSVLTNAGTMTGTTLTLGEATGNTSGKFVMGDATGVGTTTLTRITTLGSGTANAIVGGNAAASTLTLNLSADATFSGKLGGTGTNENNLAFVKQGSNTLTLSGLNTYTGATTVNAGALKAGVATTGAGGAFGNNSAVTLADVSGANLDTTGFNNSIGSLAGGGVTGGNVILGAATFTVGGDNSSTFYQGIISGSGGSLIKTGTGVFTINRTQSYTGATTVSAGTLKITGGSVNSTSGVSVAAAGTLTNDSGTVFNKALTLNEGATLNGTGSFAPSAITLTADLSDGFTTFALGTTDYTKSGNLELTLSGIANNTYTLFSGSAISGVFTTMSIGGVFLTPEGSGNFSGVVGENSYTFTDSNNQLLIVPEPSTWGLVAFSLMTVIFMRRRRSE
jgi:autotransporter-associated beta strand protein